jgi:hypothetical protein
MTDELTPRLRARAKVWATNITKAAHKNLGKFKKLITVKSKVEERGERIGVISTASPIAKDEYGDVKDVAKAYEYGSGVHSSGARGIKKKYKIAPRRAKVLAFPWEVANLNPEQFIFGKDGDVLLPSVQHPGVKAANGGKGYLRPAITEVRKQMRSEIPKETRKAVIGTFRKAFKKK